MDTIKNPLSEATRSTLAGLAKRNLEKNQQTYSPLPENSYGRDLMETSHSRANQPFIALQSLTGDEVPVTGIVAALEAAMNNYPEIRTDAAFRELITDAFSATDSYPHLQKLPGQKM